MCCIAMYIMVTALFEKTFVNDAIKPPKTKCLVFV